MDKLQKVKEILNKYEQNHLISFIDELNGSEREKLLEQILAIDFETISNLYKRIESNDKVLSKKIEPINYYDKKDLTEDELRYYIEVGENIIRSGKFAFVTMAGGQGTRLGHVGPKGTYVVDVNPEKSLFEIQCDSLKGAKAKYGVDIPWYIMTSRENNDDTIAFFEKENYFGYPKDMILFFKQGELPMVDTSGKMLLSSKSEVKEAADGSGGIFEALHKNNIIEDMKNKAVEWIFVGGIDNILLNMIDPLQVGMSIDKKVLVSSKSIVKANPHEKVGVFCKKDGRPSVIEYIEISTEMAEMRDENGELVYGESHILCNLFNIKAFEMIGVEKLPYIKAFKKSNYIDENGNEIISESPNAYKFEAFIFDAFEKFEDILILRVKREEEFAPIKNKEGVDSPATAKELYNKFWNK